MSSPADLLSVRLLRLFDVCKTVCGGVSEPWGCWRRLKVIVRRVLQVKPWSVTVEARSCVHVLWRRAPALTTSALLSSSLLGRVSLASRRCDIDPKKREQTHRWADSRRRERLGGCVMVTSVLSTVVTHKKGCLKSLACRILNRPPVMTVSCCSSDLCNR